MKNYAIIPIFIPHNGCPHDCVFCNQKKITAKEDSPTRQQIIETIERNLKTINESQITNIEIGFFGGSFTGIPISEQNYYLSIAREYKLNGKIKAIRLSTRPDYIDDLILKNLKEHSVDLIELGVQSFDDEVLELSERGHTTEQVRTASKLIKEYGFDLGVQLMIGLPGDTREKSIKSAEKLVKLNPSVARLYPTVILKDTKLMDMFRSKEYIPFNEDMMLETTTDMYEIIEDADINVIRIGLKSTDLINSESDDLVGDYHPAFSELVKGEYLYRKMLRLLEEHFADTDVGDINLKDSHSDSNDTPLNDSNYDSDNNSDDNSQYNSKNESEILIPSKKPIYNFVTNSNDISKLVGHKGRNRKTLEIKYPHLNFRFSGSADCLSGSVNLIVSEN